MKNTKYLKILLILGIAYIFSGFSIKNIFISESPKINPFFVSNTVAKANNFLSKTKNFVASLNPLKNITNSNQQNIVLTPRQITNTSQSRVASISRQIENMSLKEISQGVYAGEVDNTQVTEIRIGEIDYLEYTFNVNGKEIKIKVPKDQQPPSQEVVNVLYK